MNNLAVPLISMLALPRLADAAHGYVGADLYAVCLEGICLSSSPVLRSFSFSSCYCADACASSAAQHKALKRSLDCGGGCEGVRVTGEDMICALKEVRPSAMREVTIEVPKVRQTMGGVAELYNGV